MLCCLERARPKASMDKRHHPEPWSVRVSEDGCVEVLDARGDRFLHLWGEEDREQLLADAVRVMVCVNLCSGVPTPHLESMVRSRRLGITAKKTISSPPKSHVN